MILIYITVFLPLLTHNFQNKTAFSKLHTQISKHHTQFGTVNPDIPLQDDSLPNDKINSFGCICVCCLEICVCSFEKAV